MPGRAEEEKTMPLYEYRCTRCGAEFEVRRRMSEMDAPAPCPQCGSDSHRLVSVFASKVGFYVRAPSKPAFRKRDQQD